MQAKLRQQVHQKYAGRCAYCGNEITIKQMHVDHLNKPLAQSPFFRYGVKPE